MNCNSKCCLPDLFDNGTVKHYDDHGFPERVCKDQPKDDWSDCDVVEYEQREFYIIVCISVMFIALLAWSVHSAIVKNREIKKLKYKLKKAETRVQQAKLGLPLEKNS